MRVVDHKGRETTWSFRGCRILKDATRPRSALHLEARELLKKMYSGSIIFEEVKIPGTKLRFDFVFPARQAAIEVQGQQHFEYTPHFHKNVSEFVRALGRDQKKKEFCEINEIKLVVLRFDERHLWESQIREGLV